MMTLPEQIAEKLTDALRAELGKALPVDFCAPVTVSQDLRYGDYQSNVAMVLAKNARRNPRELAQALINRLADISEAEVSLAVHQFSGYGKGICSANGSHV